jgi:hypothetical protein
MINYQQKTSDLLKNGEYERAWTRHCGFLDLSIDEFMQIQWRLLQEQFDIAAKSKLWQKVFPQISHIKSVKDFRKEVPLTTYTDYAPYLADKPDDMLSRPAAYWCRTSGRGGEPKWAPYTEEAYWHLGICSLANDFLSTATKRGEIKVRPNDTMVYNTPPIPYMSGLAMQALSKCFDFRYIPAIDETEQMDYQERNAQIFKQAMIDGMDLLGSMTIVAVKMGEQFEQGLRSQGRFSLNSLHPRLLWRVIRATARARKEGRNYILPRDLWQPRGVMCGGADTTLYRERIKAYWGVYPHEIYGCTEAGILAMQAWDHMDMTFIPDTAFYEFIPSSAWAAERLQGTPPQETLLMNELEVGKRYEVVISNFFGGAFLRYRMHDLVEVTGLRNAQLGIQLPQFRFYGRSGDFIDLSGFAGLIDERQLTTALNASHIAYNDWVVCKEIHQNDPALHMYIELAENEATMTGEELSRRIHEQLKLLNKDYADIENMLGYTPLSVSLLKPCTFSRYMKQQIQQGADMAHLKPARIQPPVNALQTLLTMSAEGNPL